MAAAPSATAAPTKTASATPPPPLISTATPILPTPLPLPTQVVTPAQRIFTIGLAVAPGSLDPANAVDESALLITRHLYEGLTAYAPGTTRAVPALAESWETTDAITWTFHLRPNVFFSDGTPFTATIAVKNFERWSNRQAPGDYVFWKSLFGGFADERDEKGQPLSRLVSTAAPDAQTLVIVLRQPDAALPNTLAMPSFAMVNPAAFESPATPGTSDSSAGKSSAGTGAFILKDQTAEGLVHLVRNSTYWGAPAAPDELVFKPIPDDTQRLMALEVGEIDGLSRLNPTLYAAAHGDAKLRVDFDPALSVLYLGFNQAHAPWNILDCRLAVAQALDKARYVQEFFPGDAETATTAPSTWSKRAPTGKPVWAPTPSQPSRLRSTCRRPWHGPTCPTIRRASDRPFRPTSPAPASLSPWRRPLGPPGWQTCARAALTCFSLAVWASTATPIVSCAHCSAAMNPPSIATRKVTPCRPTRP